MFSFDEELFNSASDKIVSVEEQIEKLKNTIDAISSSDINDYKSDIESIVSSFQLISDDVIELNERIVRTKLLVEISKVSSDQYKNLLRQLCPDNLQNTILKLLIEIDASPFSLEPNQFGGAQQSPHILYEKYILNPDQLTDVEKSKIEDIINLFGEKGIVDQNEIDYLLTLSKYGGCGHMAITNIICDAYRNNPEVFEKKYGYKLYYTEDGKIQYNYESVFVDTFLSINNDRLDILLGNEKNRKLMEMFGIPVDDVSIWFDNMPDALNSMDSAITATVLKRDISVDSYKKYVENGDYDYSIIGVRNFTMEPYLNNNDTDIFHTKSGHWMIITDVSNDDNFIVSSWSKGWKLTEGTPYVKEKVVNYQPLDENDGGLLFVKVGDINAE